MKKDRGVSTKVAENYYKMMERTRIILNKKYNIKVSSHVKLTNLMCLDRPPYKNKSWIKQIRSRIKYE